MPKLLKLANVSRSYSKKIKVACFFGTRCIQSYSWISVVNQRKSERASMIMNSTSWPWCTMLTARLFSEVVDVINVGPNTIARFWGCIRFSALRWITLQQIRYDSQGFRRRRIGLHGKPIAELQSVTCHMGSHSVTCHTTQVNLPHLNPRQRGRYSIYLACRDGRLGWLW